MPNIRFLEHPDHWLKRAERVRLMAEQTNDSVSRELLLRIAEDLERLAEHEHALMHARNAAGN
jgi:hypothetical protein